MPGTEASMAVASNRTYITKRIGDTGEPWGKPELIGASKPG